MSRKVNRAAALVATLTTVLAGTAAAQLATADDGSSSSTGPTGSAASKVGVWLTDLPAGARLARQPDLTWRSGPPSGDPAITLDERRQYQSMIGFGASFTDSSAWLVGTRLSPAKRAAALRDLFSRRDGIGLSFVRQPMGASDFAVDGNYSYDDQPAGQTDPTLADFSVGHDEAYVIPVLRQALRENPRLTIMASPWSPPGWMKTSGSMIGGSLREDAYQPLATYFAKFVRAYARHGVPIRYITPNNEPLYVPSGYPGMSLSAEQAARLIRDNLGPTLRREGLGTEILGYDHNWDVVGYPESLYADPGVSRYVAGTAWHCYGGDVRAQSVSHNDYPGKPAFHTECSGGEWEGDDQAGFTGAMNLVVNAPREWAKGVVRWNMALDGQNGPTNGGCLTCRGVLKVTQQADGSWTYAKTVDYYALGHAGKFVQVGARRIASSTLGAGSVQDVAYRNPDGSKAVVAYNSGTSRQAFNVRFGDRWFGYALNPGAAATFTWSGTQRGAVSDAAIGSVDIKFSAPGEDPVVTFDAGLAALQDRVRIGSEWLGYSLPTGASLTPPTPAVTLPRTGWTVSAIASADSDPPGNAVDGDPATRWSTGRGMQPGDWYQIDLGKEQPISSVELDAGASAGDFARGYEISVSSDGVTWGQPIATGGGRTLTRALFPTVSARYVRIVNQGSSGSWWSIHELKVFGPADATAAKPAPAATGGRVQTKAARLPDGTEVTAFYNASRSVVSFPVQWGESTYTYRLPSSAVALFTRSSG
ncbi:discoidin domain-containing protein [Flindersiella endophytica]